MSDFTLKTYDKLDVIESLSESSHVIVEENGDVKRYPVTSIGGGVSSWNDLTDKPFDESFEQITLVPFVSLSGKTKYYDVEHIDIGIVQRLENMPAIVIFDGTTYNLNIWLEFTQFEIANGYRYHIGGSDYPFEVCWYENNNGLWVKFNDVEEHSIEIFYKQSIINPLDTKYLPKHDYAWNDLSDKPFGEVEAVSSENVTFINKRISTPGLTDDYAYWIQCETPLVLGEIYTITINGVAYEVECTLEYINGDHYVLRIPDIIYLVQNVHVVKRIKIYSYPTFYEQFKTGTIEIKVVGPTAVTKTVTLDEKYIPDTIARATDVPSGSWNDLTDKPVTGGKMVIVGTTGTADIPRNYKRVSDYAATLDDFKRGGTIELGNGNVINFTAEDVIFGDPFKTGFNNCIYVPNAYFFIATEKFIKSDYGRATVTPGIYFESLSLGGADGNNYNHTLTFYAKEYLDPEVVSVKWEDLANKPLKKEEMVIVGYDGPTVIPGGPFKKASDYVPILADFKNGGTMDAAGRLITFTAEDVTFGDFFGAGFDNCIYSQKANFYVITKEFEHRSGPTIAPGTYFFQTSPNPYTLTFYPERYLDSNLVTVKWDDLEGKPAEYPSNWEQVSNKPDEFTSNWDILNNKPLKDIADYIISEPTGNYATTSIGDFKYMSKVAPTVEELSNGFDVTTEYGITTHYTADDLVTGDYFGFGFTNVYPKDLSFMIFYESDENGTIQDYTVRKGTYFSSSQLVKTLTVNSRTILDPDKIKVGWEGITNIPDTTTSWNDLKDKPFGDGIVKKYATAYEKYDGIDILFKNLELTNNIYNDYAPGIFFHQESGEVKIELGNETYSERLYSSEDGVYGGYYGYIGDSSLSRVPFYITFNEMEASMEIKVSENILPTTFSLYREVNGVIVLDSKYIGNDIARVSDIPEGFSGSWNDLEDKPFDVSYTDTLIWDGIIRPDMATLEGTNNGTAYRISEVVPTYDDLINHTTITLCDGSVIKIDDGYVPEVDGDLQGYYVVYDGACYVVCDSEIANAPLGIYTPHPDTEFYIVSLTIDGQEIFETIKTLDPKYLPDHKHSWNDLEDKPFYSDETIFAHVENVDTDTHGEDGSFYTSSYFGETELPESVSSLVGANVSATINGTQINGVLKEVTYYSDYFGRERTSVAVGNLHLLNNKSNTLVDTGEDWCISVNVGENYPYDNAVVFTVYSRQEESNVIVESLTCFTSNIKTIDPKYLPAGDDVGLLADFTFNFQNVLSKPKTEFIGTEGNWYLQSIEWVENKNCFYIGSRNLSEFSAGETEALIGKYDANFNFISSTKVNAGHINDLAYCDETGLLYAATESIGVNSNCIVAINPDTLAIENVYNFDKACYQLSYDRKNKQFIGNFGGLLKFLNTNCEVIRELSFDIPDYLETAYTFQSTFVVDGQLVFVGCGNNDSRGIILYHINTSNGSMISCYTENIGIQEAEAVTVKGNELYLLSGQYLARIHKMTLGHKAQGAQLYLDDAGELIPEGTNIDIYASRTGKYRCGGGVIAAALGGMPSTYKSADGGFSMWVELFAQDCFKSVIVSKSGRMFFRIWTVENGAGQWKEISMV